MAHLPLANIFIGEITMHKPNRDDLTELKKAGDLLTEHFSISDALYADMAAVIDRTPELTERVSKHYEMLDAGQNIRPDLPNDMQILYMRDRQTFMTLIFPETLKMQYELGRLIGEKFIAPHLTGKTLPELMTSARPMAEAHNYALQELVECTETFARYRNHQCADCYGMPNLGMKICSYEAGTAAGQLETPLGKKVEVTEVKCCANGDEYCEFEIRVLD